MVVETLACPINFWMVRMLTPCSRRWVAKLCRSESSEGSERDGRSEAEPAGRGLQGGGSSQ